MALLLARAIVRRERFIDARHVLTKNEALVQTTRCFDAPLLRCSQHRTLFQPNNQTRHRSFYHHEKHYGDREKRVDSILVRYVKRCNDDFNEARDVVLNTRPQGVFAKR
jgi:hypothetical protein